MKKLIVLFVTIVSCQVSFGQTITLKEAFEVVAKLRDPSYWGGEFMSDEKDKDKAYEAPNSVLTKKWFFVPRDKDREFFNGYIQFYPNKTFKIYQTNAQPIIEDDDDYAYHSEISGKWNRSKLDLTLTYNYNTAKCIMDDLSGFSMRKRDEIKKESLDWQKSFKKWGIKTEKCKIEILNEDVLVINNSGYICCFFVSEKYLNEKKK